MSEIYTQYVRAQKCHSENLLIKGMLSELFKAEEDYGSGFYNDSEWTKKHAMLAILSGYKYKSNYDTIFIYENYRKLTEEEQQELKKCSSLEEFVSGLQLKLAQEIVEEREK